MSHREDFDLPRGLLTFISVSHWLLTAPKGRMNSLSMCSEEVSPEKGIWAAVRWTHRSSSKCLDEAPTLPKVPLQCTLICVWEPFSTPCQAQTLRVGLWPGTWPRVYQICLTIVIGSGMILTPQESQGDTRQLFLSAARSFLQLWVISRTSQGPDMGPTNEVSPMLVKRLREIREFLNKFPDQDMPKIYNLLSICMSPSFFILFCLFLWVERSGHLQPIVHLISFIKDSEALRKLEAINQLIELLLFCK
jgi:hypothetical protein